MPKKNGNQRELLDGRRFGRLLVCYDLEDNRFGNRQVLCRCDCLNYQVVLASSLTCGRTTSCGCLLKKNKSVNPREYRIWSGIKQRCLNCGNRQWPEYGGRGIGICERWLHSFEAFLEDMGPAPANHSIDRINNDGSYEPGNCRWATDKQQCRNHRRNRLLTINGQTKTVVEWSECSGVNAAALYQRVYAGWPEHRLLEPAMLGKNQFST